MFIFILLYIRIVVFIFRKWISNCKKNLNTQEKNVNDDFTKKENKCKKCSKFITPGATY
jgi:hypothetical protein